MARGIWERDEGGLILEPYLGLSTMADRRGQVAAIRIETSDDDPVLGNGAIQVRLSVPQLDELIAVLQSLSATIKGDNAPSGRGAG